jgi:hypothetical protein
VSSDRHLTFAPGVIDRLDAVREVDIETRTRAGERRVTRIWIVTNGTDVFVRSVRGNRGRWYRDLLATQTGALRIGSDRVEVRATIASDPASVALISDLLRAKYGKRSPASTRSMLRPHTLETNLRLDPA